MSTSETPQTISEDEAIQILEKMTPDGIQELKQSALKALASNGRNLRSKFLKAWGGKHNIARTERAKARILKRKGKWNDELQRRKRLAEKSRMS